MIHIEDYLLNRYRPLSDNCANLLLVIFKDVSKETDKIDDKILKLVKNILLINENCKRVIDRVTAKDIDFSQLEKEGNKLIEDFEINECLFSQYKEEYDAITFDVNKVDFRKLTRYDECEELSVIQETLTRLIEEVNKYPDIRRWYKFQLTGVRDMIKHYLGGISGFKTESKVYFGTSNEELYLRHQLLLSKKKEIDAAVLDMMKIFGYNFVIPFKMKVGYYTKKYVLPLMAVACVIALVVGSFYQ